MPAIDPLTGLPKPPAAPWLGSLGSENASMADQVAALGSKDSALNRMAATEGLKVANRRGLLNSSMAVSAAQDSVLKNIMPIAQQDAAAAAARNAAARAFEYGMTAQEGNQGFLTGERIGGEQHETAEAKALREWQTSEAQAGRNWQTGERLGSETHQTSEREATQTYASTQTALDRLLQEKLQSNEIDATRANLISSLASAGDIAAANRELEKYLTETGRSWQTEERKASQQFTTGERIGTQDFQLKQQSIQNDLAKLMQNNELDAAQANLILQINSTEGINAANNALQRELQKKQQDWQTKEREGTQEWSTAEREDTQGWQTAERLGEQGFEATQNGLNRNLQALLQKNQITADQKLQNDRIRSEEGLQAANRNLQLVLQKNDLKSRMDIGKLDIASAEKMQQADIAFQKSQGVATRALQEKIAKMNLSGTMQTVAAQFISTASNQYQAQYNSIMNNPDLSKEARTEQLKGAQNRYGNQMKLAEDFFEIDIKWA